jgi:hypothetical protein
MGSSLTKSNTSSSIIYPDSTNNESVVIDIKNDLALNIDESTQTKNQMERGNESSQLINKLEKDGCDKLTNLVATFPSNATSEDFGDALINIMKSGADEFKEKTGRNMSYCEMRAAYG